MMDKINAPQREKFWTEKDHDEKLETLRTEVKQLGRLIYEIHELVESLKIHGHDSGGRIVVPMGGNGKNYPEEKRLPWRYQWNDGKESPF